MPAAPESPQQLQAFEIYFANRSYAQTAQEMGVAQSTVKLWSTKYNWDSRLRKRNEALIQDIQQKMEDDWKEIRLMIFNMLWEKIQAAKDITPKNTKDLVMLIKELRSLMGEQTVQDIEQNVQIEFVLPDTSKPEPPTIDIDPNQDADEHPPQPLSISVDNNTINEAEMHEP